MKYDLIIIGGGPAACAAGVYAARKQLKTLLIAKDFAGQSVVSSEIYNWIGSVAISGAELAKALETHVKSYKGEYLDIVESSIVTKVTGAAGSFVATTDSEHTYEGKAVLVTAGANRRKLTVPGALEYDQKGLTYCATCDGPIFSGMDVAVIGGGNAGFESAAQLLAYVKSVTLLEYGATFKADAITVENVLKHPNMQALTNVEIVAVQGEQMVNALVYRDRATNEEHVLPVGGIFVEIGMMPNTSMVEGLVELTEYKKVKVDPRTQRASVLGVWAAGDCTDGLYSQNNIAVGDAVKAIENIYAHLKA